MNYRIRQCLSVASIIIVALCGLVNPSSSEEQAAYPANAITIIAPYGAGGSLVTGARFAATALQEKFGVPVVVQSIPGPNGWNQIYRAEPDGYTLGVGDNVGEYAGTLMNPMPYDIKEFEVLGAMNSALTLIAAGGNSGISNFEELVAAGQNGNTLRYSSFGFSAALVQMTLLSQRLNFDMTQVVFGSARDTVVPIVRGDADVGALGTWMFLDQVESGGVKPILLWSTEPDPRLPDVPNLVTVGLEDLSPVMSHRVLFAPPGTPAEIQKVLVDALQEIFSSEDMKTQLEAVNLETNSLWGEDFKLVLDESFAAIDQHKDAILDQAQ